MCVSGGLWVGGVSGWVGGQRSPARFSIDTCHCDFEAERQQRQKQREIKWGFLPSDRSWVVVVVGVLLHLRSAPPLAALLLLSHWLHSESDVCSTPRRNVN